MDVHLITSGNKANKKSMSQKMGQKAVRIPPDKGSDRLSLLCPGDKKLEIKTKSGQNTGYSSTNQWAGSKSGETRYC